MTVCGLFVLALWKTADLLWCISPFTLYQLGQVPAYHLDKHLRKGKQHYQVSTQAVIGEITGSNCIHSSGSELAWIMCSIHFWVSKWAVTATLLDSFNTAGEEQLCGSVRSGYSSKNWIVTCEIAIHLSTTIKWLFKLQNKKRWLLDELGAL